MTSLAPARTAVATLAAVTVLLATVGACSGDEDADARPTGPTSSAASATPSAGESTSASASASPESTAVLQARLAGTVVEGLAAPWGLTFLPDGSALVSERDTARIKRVTPDGDVSTVGRVRGVAPRGEGGLLGIAVSPTYESDSLLYAYFTAPDENRVVRMRYDGNRLSGQETILDGIPAGAIHNGGRIAFGPDGLLYVGTGEAGQTDLSQRRRSLGGKILRVTPEGRPAPGNPFGSSPVYSLGHRNVQGIAWDASGQLWAAEFGQNTWDELNRIEAGGNYGWPEVEGRARDDRFRDPVRQWDTDEASPSGIAIAGNSVFMAALRGARLWQVPIPGGQAGDPQALLRGDYGRLRTVGVAPDGSLWLMTSNRDGRGDVRDGDDRILRLTLS